MQIAQLQSPETGNCKPKSGWRALGINEISGLAELGPQSDLTSGPEQRLFSERPGRRDSAPPAIVEVPQRDGGCPRYLIRLAIVNRKNLDQLLFDGYRNFKRTIALNFFTRDAVPIQAGDPRLASLRARLDRADFCPLRRLQDLARSPPDDPGSDLPDQLHYRYVVLLLWAYIRQVDRRKYLDRLKEPLEGNPMLVPVEGQNASQDLANSLIEYYSIGEGSRSRAAIARWKSAAATAETRT